MTKKKTVKYHKTVFKLTCGGFSDNLIKEFHTTEMETLKLQWKPGYISVL